MYFLTIKFAFSPTKKRGTPPQIALTRHTSLYIFILDWSVQLRARRDVVVHHEEVQLLVLAVLQMLTAESNMPQDSMPIMGRGGRFVIAIRVFPISSSGS